MRRALVLGGYLAPKVQRFFFLWVVVIYDEIFFVGVHCVTRHLLCHTKALSY